MKLTDLPVRQGFVALLLGKQGSGKSGAAASFSEEGNTLVTDLDFRAKGIIGCANFLGQALIDRIDVERYKMEDGFSAIDKRLEILSIQAKSNQLRYRNLQFDSVGSLIDFLKVDSMILRGAFKGSNEKLGPGQFTGKKRGVVPFAGFDDYGYVLLAFSQLYDIIKIMPCNIIFTGHTQDSFRRNPVDEYAEPIYLGQKLSAEGQLQEKIPGKFDEVYYFEKVETGMSNAPVKYTVEFESHLAKTCFDQLKGLGKVDITGKSFYQFLKSKGVIVEKQQKVA